MALNVIERLTLIAERLKDIADKIEGGGGGSLEPRVAALEITTQLLDSQKANDDIIALPFAGSGVAGNYYIYNKELWLCVTNTSTPPSQGSSAWSKKNVGDELTRARGDIVSLNTNIMTIQTSSITPVAPFDIDGLNIIEKVGRLCRLNFSIYRTNDIIYKDVTYTIGTIPSGFRPTRSVVEYYIKANSNVEGRVLIESNGTIKFVSSKDSSDRYVLYSINILYFS